MFFSINIDSAVLAKENNDKSAILVIVDNINIENLDGDYPNLHNLIKQGSMGLMNIRAAGRYNFASGYLTIGTGVRSSVSGAVDKIFSFEEIYEDEKAGELYENFTGKKASAKNIIVLDIPKIIAENQKQDYEIVPGLLGEKLKNAGINIFLMGQADSIKSKNRPAALITMDKDGLVQYGVGGQELLEKDRESPFFIKTNYEKMLEKFKLYKNEGGFWVIHLGDIMRADNYRTDVTEERYDFFRKKALKEIDTFVGSLMEELDFKEDLLILTTPFPSPVGYKEGNLLTPLIVCGPEMDNGLVISATTRREGVIANIDIAPTILSFFNLDVPVIMLGNPIKSILAENAFPDLLEMNKQIKNTFNQRSYLIKPFVAFQVVVSLIFLLLFLFKKRWLYMIRPFLFASMFIPFVFLIMPIFTSPELISKFFWLVILTLVLVIMAYIFKNTLNSIVFISIIMALGIIIDLLRGSALMKLSILGYDPIGGSRYYGLGNEYMGILISSLIIGIMGAMNQLKINSKPFIILFSLLPFAFTFYLIMSPNYGSNVGGTISAFGAFLVVVILATGVRFRLKHVIILLFGLTLVLIILFLFISFHTTPSHISKTVELIKDGGMSSIFLVLGRKLAMNYKLLKYTIWTRALLTSIGIIAYLLYKPPYLLKKIFQKYNKLYCGFIGSGVGCFLALLVNDSGIVAAATMMIYIAFPVILLVIDELEKTKNVIDICSK